MEKKGDAQDVVLCRNKIQIVDFYRIITFDTLRNHNADYAVVMSTCVVKNIENDAIGTKNMHLFGQNDCRQGMLWDAMLTITHH